MKKKINFISILLVIVVACQAQKKNYFSLEAGSYFGNANNKIESNMIASRFGDDQNNNFLNLFYYTTRYPQKSTSKDKYRIRGGHFLNNKTAVEVGFGLSYYGTVDGFNSGSGYLSLTSKIHTIYVAWVKSDSARSVGFGLGPAFSLYKLTGEINQKSNSISENYFLPGMMINGYWNFVHRRSWFAGLRSEFSLTMPAKIKEIKVTSTNSEATFRATKAGALNGNFAITAGIRF